MSRDIQRQHVAYLVESIIMAYASATDAGVMHVTRGNAIDATRYIPLST